MSHEHMCAPHKHVSSLILDHFACMLIERMRRICWYPGLLCGKCWKSNTVISPSHKCKKHTLLFPERTICKINYLSLIIQGSVCLWCPLGTKGQEEKNKNKKKLKQLIRKKKPHSDVRELRLERFQDQRWVIHFHTNMWEEKPRKDGYY